MNQDANDNSVSPKQPATGPPVWAAVGVALVGSLLVAMAEIGAGLAVSRAYLTPEASLTRLVGTAILTAAGTHFFVWCTFLLIAGCVGARCCRGAIQGSHVPWLSGLFVAAAGSVVVCADLMMIGRAGAGYLVGGVLGALVAGLVTWLLLDWALRRLGRSRFEWVTRITAALAVCSVLIAGVALSIPWGKAPLAHAVRDRPNVVLIVLDTVRAHRMSVYGYGRPTTPFLERWAERAITFERAITPGIWTVPGHASMFTGLSTREHGADIPGRWLDDAHRTLAESLRERGYVTGGFSNNPWISPDANLVRGFRHFVGLNHYRRLNRFSLSYLVERWGITPPQWLDGDYGAVTTNKLIGQWLDQHSTSGDPFFLFANYMEAHAPYRVPRGYREMFMTIDQVHRSYDLRLAVHGEIADVLHYAFNIEGAHILRPADREVLARQYDAAIRYLDDRVAELVGMLEARGLLDQTLVIITADHGEYLDEHGMWAHTFLAYDGVTRVPLMIREPGRESGMRVTTPARLADIHHTIMRMVDGAGYEAPGHDTRDLIELASQPPSERTVVTSWSGAEDKLARRIARSDDPEVRHRGRAQTAIQDGRYKLLVSVDGRRELYDLQSDPEEVDNLIDREPQIRARLEARLAEWEATVPRYVPEKRTGVEPMSAQMLRDLAALGYAGSEDEDEDEDEDEPAPD